jgi:hypothetical protein
MSNDFDMACRRMVKVTPVPFLVWLLRDFATIARFLGWVDTRRIAFPGRPDQTGDLVFELELLQQVQELWALALEFQLEPDPTMFGRLLIYLGTIWLEQQPDRLRGSQYQLGACVINLTGTSKSGPATRKFIWPGADGTECILVVRERYLGEEPAQDLLEAIATGRYDRALLPWIPLMAGGSEPATIARWLELVGGLDESLLADLAYNTLVFAEKSNDPQAWSKALEGFGMIRSETMENTREEGRVETRQEDLLDVVGLRTRQTIPEELTQKIRACRNHATLRAWLAVAITVDTLDQFRQQTGL